MKKFFIIILFVLFFISLSSVCADGNYTSLGNEIINSGNYLELSQNYSYDKNADDREFIPVSKNNFTLNGNGHTINANNASAFMISGTNVTLNNLVIANAHTDSSGGAVSTPYFLNLTLNNVTFINNSADQYGGCIESYGILNANNVKFINNFASLGGSDIYLSNAIANLYNCSFTNEKGIYMAHIYGKTGSEVNVDNSIFYNTSSKYATAILNDKKTYIKNSVFKNLYANTTAGAIIAKSFKVL